MAKVIKIQSGKQIISIESDDAGVPDVTEGTGPDLIKLQEDNVAPQSADNAEFDAAKPDSAVEKEDATTQAVEKANESFFNAIFGLEDGEEATVGGEEPAVTETPETSDNAPAAASEPEPAAEEPSNEGAGEVTEGDGVTTIDAGDVVITISNSEKEAEPATETPAEPEPAEGGESADAGAAPETPAPEAASGEACGCGKGKEGSDAAATDKAIESFFANLGL